jgi:ArsR family transcriptional regulator
MSKTSTEFADMLRVLGDPKRLAIFRLLLQGVQCNCEIGDNLNMPMNLISHHLKVLRDAGLVNTERDVHDARWIYYSVNRCAISELREQLAGFFDVKRIQPRQPKCGPRVRSRKPVASR